MTEKYTTEELLDELRTIYLTTGKPPTVHGVGYRSRTIMRRFGTWNNAMSLAGIPTFVHKVNHLTCFQCEQTFTRYKTGKKPSLVFCSRACKDIHDKTNSTYLERRKLTGRASHLSPKRKQTTKQYCSVWFNTCVVCQTTFTVKSSKQVKAKCCSVACITKRRSDNGLRVYTYFNKRSKNEILLGELLSSKFSNIVFNEPRFNGWDADIIIPDLKLAILWNGAWHYAKITNTHSVQKVQNRDRIKMREILHAGYNFIIVKDHRNKMTPQKALQKIEQLIETKTFNCSIF